MASNTSSDKSPARPDWFIESLDDAEGWKKTRAFLLEYTSIPDDKIAEHVYQIRERAWSIYNYPCIGAFRFLDRSIAQLPRYPEILQRVKAGDKLLDLGCCFGQDVRRLVADGAPSENIYAGDLCPEFQELGYDLFLDKETLRAHFFAADVFDDSNAQLKSLDGTIDIVHASSFFHLWAYESQKKAAKRVVQLLRKKEGSMVAGRQMANVNAGSYSNKIREGEEIYRHNGESWEKMWKEVGEETGTQWHVETQLNAWNVPGRNKSLGDEGIMIMKYYVRML